VAALQRGAQQAQQRHECGAQHGRLGEAGRRARALRAAVLAQQVRQQLRQPHARLARHACV